MTVDPLTVSVATAVAGTVATSFLSVLKLISRFGADVDLKHQDSAIVSINFPDGTESRLEMSTDEARSLGQTHAKVPS